MHLHRRVRLLELRRAAPAPQDPQDCALRCEAFLARWGTPQKVVGAGGGPVDVRRPFASVSTDDLRAVLRRLAAAGATAR